eukprot:164125-Amorphochlora_amoeboformis.AAC.1
MSTFVMHNYDTLKNSFRDLVKSEVFQLDLIPCSDIVTQMDLPVSFSMHSSQNNEPELRLQLLRAFLAMPSDRLVTALTTHNYALHVSLAEELVRQLSKDVPQNFSSEFGDVLQITFPGYYAPSETVFIDTSAQADLCHIVHVEGSRASRMCLVDSNKGTLEPISKGQNSSHSTALDLFINNGLNAKAVSSLPDFMYIANSDSYS